MYCVSNTTYTCCRLLICTRSPLITRQGFWFWFIKTLRNKCNSVTHTCISHLSYRIVEPKTMTWVAHGYSFLMKTQGKKASRVSTDCTGSKSNRLSNDTTRQEKITLNCHMRLHSCNQYMASDHNIIIVSLYIIMRWRCYFLLSPMKTDSFGTKSRKAKGNKYQAPSRLVWAHMCAINDRKSTCF